MRNNKEKKIPRIIHKRRSHNHTYVYFLGKGRKCVSKKKVIQHQITEDANIPLAYRNRPILCGYTAFPSHYCYYPLSHQTSIIVQLAQSFFCRISRWTGCIFSTKVTKYKQLKADLPPSPIPTYLVEYEIITL